MDEYMTIKDASKKWGIGEQRILHCNKRCRLSFAKTQSLL